MEGLPLSAGDKVRATLFGARPCDFQGLDTTPEGIVTIEPTTSIRMETRGKQETRGTRVSYEDIGGLQTRSSGSGR